MNGSKTATSTQKDFAQKLRIDRKTETEFVTSSHLSEPVYHDLTLQMTMTSRVQPEEYDERFDWEGKSYVS